MEALKDVDQIGEAAIRRELARRGDGIPQNRSAAGLGPVTLRAHAPLRREASHRILGWRLDRQVMSFMV